MASTTTKANQPTVKIGVETEVPKSRRGKQPDQTVIQVQEALKASMKDGDARSFEGITVDNREEWARKVRKAGENLNIKVATIFDPDKGKLFWGPDDVVKKLR